MRDSPVRAGTFPAMTQPTSTPVHWVRPPRRALLGVLVRSFATVVGVILLYAFLPLAGHSSATTIFWLISGMALLTVLVGRQVYMILQADYPRLRAIEALFLVVPVLLVVFAFTYASMSDVNPANFTEPLSRIDAIYFSTTVLGTVGFGDIAATSDMARLLVTFQILVGLGSAVGLARLFLGAADVNATRRQASGRSDGPPDAN